MSFEKEGILERIMEAYKRRTTPRKKQVSNPLDKAKRRKYYTKNKSKILRNRRKWYNRNKNVLKYVRKLKDKAK